MSNNICDTRRFELIHEAGERFDAIMDAIDVACERYAIEKPPAWSMDVSAPDVIWMRTALCDMWHEGQGSGASTSKHVGIVAASPELRNDFHAINKAKAAFQDVIRAMKQTKPAYNYRTQLKEMVAHRHPAVREHLNAAGMGRLSLKKVWRRIFVFDDPVRHVGIGWYVSGRSIVKISVAEAEKRLIRLGADDPNIAVQLKQLASLPSGEVLAHVKQQTPLLRCNVRFEIDEDNEKGLPASVGMNSSMPVLVPPYSSNGLLPPLRTPPAFPPIKSSRRRRRDAKLEEVPFLPAINVYRYLSDL